jgi:integrase
MAIIGNFKATDKGFTGTISTLALKAAVDFEPVGDDIYRMMKRRLKDFDLPLLYSPHSFRVTTITDLLTQNVPREDVQHLAGHADARTTGLYDRRKKKISRNIVERISV